MTVLKQLYLPEIDDEFTRENFKRVRDGLLEDHLFRTGFKFLTLSIPGAVTNEKFFHSLGFTPRDILQTSLIGAGSLTWNYELFDAQSLNVTTTGPCVVRAFVGTYKEK